MPWHGERFRGTIGLTPETSVPHWRIAPRPAEGSPNVLMVVLDDIGYGHLGCYGSDIETPVIDGLAGRGLRYTNFHTTALCSPTRACLLTGRNHHTAGLGCIAELSQGYPGYDGMLPPTVALVSEVMSERGYATFAIGKWHLCPAEECTPAGPYTRWPLGRGFDHFYGFLGGETNQYYPDLVRDNTFVEQPTSAAEGYHLTEDLTDSAIAYVRDLRSVDQTKPFFMYFCPGACHAPHQVPQEWIDRYRGKFDKGWDAWREETFRRQKALGIVPQDTELSPRPEWVAAWDSLGDDERRLYARMMEVFAAFLSHTDHHLGRLIEALRKTGDLDNTLIMLVSDNGASGEGGFHGSFNEHLIFNGIPDTVEQNLRHIDDLGSERSFGHYPTGWVMAANTPFRRWKRNVHNGGISDPFVVSWPAKITATGEVRTQYTHAIDVAATVMEAVGMEFPHHVKGVPQESVAGESLVPTFNDGAAQEVRTTQYYEMFGSRALYKDGWKAVTFHAPPGIPADGPGDPNLPFTKDEWELYDLRSDRTEIRNLAEVEPARLQEMIVLWYVEAGKHNVLPLHAEQQKGQRPRPFTEPEVYRYWPHTTRIDNEAAVKVLMRPFSVLASATIPEGGAEGVLIAQGGQFGGWALFLHEGRLHYEHNFLGLESYRVASDRPVPGGDVELGLEFAVTGEYEIAPELTEMGVRGVSGVATLTINGEVVGSGEIARTVPFSYSLSGEGLCCGYDSETAVSALYEPPFPFTGILHEVLVSPKGEPVRVLAKEIERAHRTQ